MPPRIISHYEILEPVGKGGMGVVYKARDLKLERFAALKFLSPGLLSSPEARSRFLKEAHALSALSHPHVATVYEVDDVEGTLFLAMEYLPGGTLRDRVADARASGSPIADRQLIDWGIGLAEGLAHAHARGIVHRDVKCSNAMFDEEGRIKLTDFGLAKVLSGVDSTTSGAVLGTVQYMSPEQLSGGAVDQRSDLFSLGIVLYEAATGRLPFEGDTPQELAGRIIAADPPIVSLTRPEIPQGFEHVVMRLLSKAPERRYQSANDVRRDLTLVGSGAIRLAELPTETLPPQRLKRYVVAPVVAAAAVIVIVAAILVGRHFWKPPPPPLPEHKHVAVLPLRSIGGDEGQQALGDGLTETMTAALTQTGLLYVVPASDARKLETVEQARREYGVNLAIYGSLQRRGDQVRLTLNLVDAEKERQLGAETVDAPAAQGFLIEDGMLAKVANLIDVAVPRKNAAILAKQVASAPEAFDAYLRGRGFLYRYDKAGNIDRAVQQFQEAIRDDPEFALAFVGLAEARLRAWRQKRDPSTLASARDSAERALVLNPTLAVARAIFGAVLAASNERDEAVVQLEKAIALDPRDPSAYRELATVYGTLGQTDRAEMVYKKAIDARPGDWVSTSSLARFYYGENRLADAEREFRKVIEIAPDNHTGYRNLGGVLAALGKNAEAESMLLKAQSINPSPQGWSNLGVFYTLQGRYDAAVPPLEKAAAETADTAPNSYLIWGNLGDAYSLSGAPPERARAAFQKAIALVEGAAAGQPLSADLASVTAEYYAKIGDHGRARERIESALTSDPKSSSVRYQAGIVYAMLGDEPRALKELETALARGISAEQLKRAPELKTLRESGRLSQIPGYARANF